jgi:hypothetical protein
MILDKLAHTPSWVWIVFAVLVGLGLKQTRAREITPARVTILPLIFIALSVSGVVRTAASLPLALSAWATGFGAVMLFARNAVAVRGASWSVRSDRLQVPGSWLPLTLILGLFLIRYGVGVSLSLHPALAGDARVTLGCSLVFGAFAGVFWARSRSLRRLVQASPAAQAV